MSTPLSRSQSVTFKNLQSPCIVSRGFVDNALTCPICLNILNKPVAIKACMHRFCEDCAKTAIQNMKIGKKKCPFCRMALVSTRDIMRDETLENIINLIHPNINTYRVAYIKIPGVLNKTDSTAQKTLNRKNSVNSNSHTHQSPHSQSSHGAQHAVTSPAQLNALKQKRLEALKSMARFFEPEMIEQMEQELKVGQKEETPKMNRQLSQQKISGQTPKNNKGQLNDQYGYDNEYQSEEDRPTSPIDIISDEKDDDVIITGFTTPSPSLKSLKLRSQKKLSVKQLHFFNQTKSASHSNSEQDQQQRSLSVKKGKKKSHKKIVKLKIESDNELLDFNEKEANFPFFAVETDNISRTQQSSLFEESDEGQRQHKNKQKEDESNVNEQQSGLNLEQNHKSLSLDKLHSTKSKSLLKSNQEKKSTKNKKNPIQLSPRLSLSADRINTIESNNTRLRSGSMNKTNKLQEEMKIESSEKRPINTGIEQSIRRIKDIDFDLMDPVPTISFNIKDDIDERFQIDDQLEGEDDFIFRFIDEDGSENELMNESAANILQRGRNLLQNEIKQKNELQMKNQIDSSSQQTYHQQSNKIQQSNSLKQLLSKQEPFSSSQISSSSSQTPIFSVLTPVKQSHTIVNQKYNQIKSIQLSKQNPLRHMLQLDAFTRLYMPQTENTRLCFQIGELEKDKETQYHGQIKSMKSDIDIMKSQQQSKTQLKTKQSKELIKKEDQQINKESDQNMIENIDPLFQKLKQQIQKGIRMKRMIVDKDKDPGINSMKEQDQQDQNLKLMIKDKQEDEKSSDIESSSLIDQKQKRKRNEEEEEKNNKDKSNKLTDNKEEEIGKGNKRRRVDEEDQNSYNLNLYQLPPLPLFETPENPLITFTLQKDNRELSLPPFQTITLTTPSLFIVEQLTPLIKTQFIKPKPNELNKLPKAYPKRKRSISEKRMSVEESNFSTLTPQRLLDSSISQRSIQSSQSSFQTLNENHQMSLTFCVVSAGIQPEVIPSQMCIGVVYAMYTPKRQNKLLGLSFRRLRNK